MGQIEHDLLLWSKLGDSPGALAAEADYCEEFDSNPVGMRLRACVRACMCLFLLDS